MPDKPLTVATYAAGASLAAITLVYVFAPTYLIDSDSNASRKKGVVGLVNTANDCFINCVLQALAGLTDLRVYLIREVHRRNIDEAWVYKEIVKDPSRQDDPEWKNQSLQAGAVTLGLKNILDSLNERPIYRKTISASSFVRVLEAAFRQKISRQQQDAQEFLQVVAERVCDEYHAGRRARASARRKGAITDTSSSPSSPVDGEAVEQRLAGLALNQQGLEDPDQRAPSVPTIATESASDSGDDEERGFPMEGAFQSQIECQVCGFKTKAIQSTFCTLTLMVPHTSSTTLNTCLDGFFKTEYVDDYKCERCRLVHAQKLLETQVSRSRSDAFKEETRRSIDAIRHQIDTDPEKTPPGVVLPDMRYAPTCRIAKHTRLTNFPKILAIHLSRSKFENQMSQKNSAKVTFPERLSIGGILSQRKYKLLSVIIHKGSHQSGHYESFRRQNVNLPFSTTNAFQPSDVFTPSANLTPAATPSPSATPIPKSRIPSPDASTPDLVSGSSAESLSDRSIRSSNTKSLYRQSPTLSLKGTDSDNVSLKSFTASARSTMSRISLSGRGSRPSSPFGKHRPAPTSAPRSVNGSTMAAKAHGAQGQRRKHNNRWWRISDDKVKEAKTSDVLGMQREVYMLFYELEREDEAES
ncbi:hypothetical protein F5Y16DRAFT_203232 [Xylariaceae sp. FL0255]|nr:hypothetical protein F5Y16DRAFT_203232 [Xylariaceae sp. FL0255]